MNENCLHCGLTVRAFGDAWVHAKSGLITCRRSKSNQHDGIYHAEPMTVEAVATAMRDRCVREIKDRLYSPSLKFANKGIEAAIIDWTHRLIIVLQSLTLEGEQEKQK